MAIDSHMHINSIILNDEKKYIDFINNNSDIESVINVGLDLKSSKESINISELNPKFYSSVGIHPLYVESQNLEILYDLADNPRVVAIGEIVLDNTKNNFNEQKNI